MDYHINFIDTGGLKPGIYVLKETVDITGTTIYHAINNAIKDGKCTFTPKPGRDIKFVLESTNDNKNYCCLIDMDQREAKR